MGRSRYVITEPSQPHFLTCTVLEWLPVFTRPAMVQILLDSWTYLREHDGLRLYGYVVLENHLHFIAQAQRLDQCANCFKSFTARQIIDYLAEKRVERILERLRFAKRAHKTDREYQFFIPFLMLFCLLCSGCQPERRYLSEPLYREMALNDSIAKEKASKHLSKEGLSAISIKVFYGTDRQTNKLSELENYYGNQRATMSFGSCDVSIPVSHEPGKLEAPTWLKLEFSEDAKKHIALLDVSPKSKDDFFSEMRSRIERSKAKQAFIFIHGYNVNFKDAARRTAQMAYDLGFDGAPIFFSWPSQGKTINYTIDETNEEWAVPHLKEFLTEVWSRTGAESIYLIAHSMGTRALTAALREIATERPNGHLFKEIVLAAPDIDAEVFQRDILPKIRPTADRITLYASSKDKALEASKKVHGNPRAGESEVNSLVLAPGLDTIDASMVDTSFLGHSYYAEIRAVIDDLYKLIRNGDPPERRNLLERYRNGQRYWELRQ